jgi:hypothetical protein
MGTPTAFDKPLTGYQIVSTQIGDTLQKIAARTLGDASQYPLLISINKLIYPWITDDPTQSGPGIILTGGPIIVPAPTPALATQPDPEDVFLTDVGLNPDRTLSIVNGDFGTVSGTDNLKQAWTNRLITDKGTLLFHQDYGGLLRSLIGAVNGPNAGLLAAKYAEQDILQDPRAQAVLDATVNISGAAINVVADVQPKSAGQQPLNIQATL